MIRTKLKWIGLLFALIIVPITLHAQEPFKVTLFVDTGSIEKPDVDASANFGQDPDISNENFTITIAPNQEVEWEGVSTSDEENDVVNITKVKFKKGKNIFNKGTLDGEGQTRKKVKARAERGRSGDLYEYTIFFTVFNNGEQRNGRFKIDPKIKVQ